MKKHLTLFLIALLVAFGALAFTGPNVYGNEAPPVVCNACDDGNTHVAPFCILDPEKKKKG